MGRTWGTKHLGHWGHQVLQEGWLWGMGDTRYGGGSRNGGFGVTGYKGQQAQEAMGTSCMGCSRNGGSGDMGDTRYGGVQEWWLWAHQL